MPFWLQAILAFFTFIGGGIGVKVLELVRFREENVWKEIGALRETSHRQDQKIAELERQIRKYQVEVFEQRILKHKADNLANFYKLELWKMMGQVNERDIELKRKPSYDLNAEEDRLGRIEQAMQASAIEQVAAGHEAAVKTAGEHP